MLNLLTIMSIIVMLTITLMFTCLLISKKTLLYREKSFPFECGFDPKNMARNPLSIQFLLIGLIFLIFDIEIALLLPIPLSQNMTNMIIISASIMVIIISYGLYYEWLNGMLNWAK